jgi:N-acetylglucosamine-6-phosphate deacetylase
MAWQALGPRRLILVTDAVSALGLDASESRLAGVAVVVDETGVRTPAGVLAGSNLSLDRAVRNLVEYTRCTPAEAIHTATSNPAELLALGDRGRIAIGARADLVVLDPKLNVELTMIGGEVAWRS